jgi:peroxiredoxin
MRVGPLTAVVLAVLAVAIASAAVPGKPEDVTPLDRGSRAPAFVAMYPDGSVFRFDVDALARPAVLIFYRGGWCPYCNAHLAALREVVPRLNGRGFDVYFLSADRPERLRTSVKTEVPDYILLSDSRLYAARAVGIAFRVDDATYERYRALGLDLEEASGESHHELPVPAVFVIDRSGTIAYRYANPDYKVRLGAAELEAAALGVEPGA